MQRETVTIFETCVRSAHIAVMRAREKLSSSKKGLAPSKPYPVFVGLGSNAILARKL